MFRAPVAFQLSQFTKRNKQASAAQKNWSHVTATSYIEINKAVWCSSVLIMEIELLLETLLWEYLQSMKHLKTNSYFSIHTHVKKTY